MPSCVKTFALPGCWTGNAWTSTSTCLYSFGLFLNTNCLWKHSMNLEVVFDPTKGRTTRNKVKTVSNRGGDPEILRNRWVTQFSHRTTPSVFSPDPKSFLIFKHKFLMNFFLFRPYFALHVADGGPWGKSKMKKHGKKQKQTASGKVLGKHLPATTSERYYTRIQSSNYGREKYLAKANESFQFPEAEQCRNWMVKNKFNLPELHASLDITRTQIDWNRLGYQISPEKEKYETGK